MNLRPRLELAGDSLLAVLDPEHDLMPTGGWEVAHDLGRWWDAALRLEDAIGFVIPAELEAAAMRHLEALSDNPDRLLTNRADIPILADKVRLNPHNFRESLLAFGGLVRHRGSDWARDAGLQLVRSMSRALTDTGGFDFARFGLWNMVPHTADPSHMEQRNASGWFDGTATSGRAIEALVWLYECMQDGAVLDLARRLAEHHLEASTQADGFVRADIVDPDNVGHDHSYLGTLRGLLLFGLLTNDDRFIRRIAATYERGVRTQCVKESGWAPHDLGKLRFPNEFGDPVTDPASTGDAAQLALWLALRAGRYELLDDVERYVRARMLTAQLTHADTPDKGQSSFPPRDLGSWCIHGRSHGGKGCTPDVGAAVTHTLCDVHQNIVTTDGNSARINLHLDHEDDRVSVTSTRRDAAELTVSVREPVDLRIRIPGWATASSVTLAVNGRNVPVAREGVFAHLPRDMFSGPATVKLTHDLPQRDSEELMPSGRVYRFRWHGDEITGIAPQEAYRPFYPTLDA